MKDLSFRVDVLYCTANLLSFPITFLQRSLLDNQFAMDPKLGSQQGQGGG